MPRLFDHNFHALSVVVLFVATFGTATNTWAADHLTVLYNFNDSDDTGGSSLVMDSAGNLYGTTSHGGIYHCDHVGCGEVFELSPAAGGTWTETILHSFGNGSDGIAPSSPIIDAVGNLYGTTLQGGIYGWGIAYELSPGQGGQWTETVLYNFTGGNGSYGGNGTLLLDSAGNLYGTSFEGGSLGYGMTFELSPSGGGSWTETVLHNFGSGTDGTYPANNGGLVMDAAGNLYGTTLQGGNYCPGSFGCGTVYELSPSGGGWNETMLHSFDGHDGYQPRAGLVFDSSGSLYGTTYQGSGPYCPPFGCGTVFELSQSEGSWTERTIFNFRGAPDAADPQSSLVVDTAGNLYGTSGGGATNYGAVFELSHRKSGGWMETVPFSFDLHSSAGYLASSVIVDKAGNLYGTTGIGGIYGNGTVFELTPANPCLTCRHD